MGHNHRTRGPMHQSRHARRLSWEGVTLAAARGGEAPRLTWATGGGRTVSRMGGW